jgi:hypothetical protein
VSSQNLDPDAMARFCYEQVPTTLRVACDVDDDTATEIGEDMLRRANAFASLSESDQATVSAPFVEESFNYEPATSPALLKAAVTVTVRNSNLEQVPVDGLVNAGGLQVITAAAAAPLSHLLAVHRRILTQPVSDGPFATLESTYPRAWACLTALADAVSTGGRTGFRLPAAPIPELPGPAEQVGARPSGSDGRNVVLSGIDPLFDDQLIRQMEAATASPLVAYVPSLSRFSRNSEKLHRVLEFFLAHGSSVLTSNYLLRSNDVWVRRHRPVQPDSRDYARGIRDQSGLSGAHRTVVQQLAAQLDEQFAAD